MECLSEKALAGLVARERRATDDGATLAHVAGCPRCGEMLALLEREALAAAAEQSTLGMRASPVEAGSTPQPRVERIGPYVLLELLGSGGMGVVYTAYHAELDRKVAIKLLRPEGEGQEARLSARARLLREAQAMAKLDHPNVVAVHDAGTYEQRVYLVMDRVEGSTLREWLAEKPRPWRDVLEVCVQAGRGLAAAHAVGLVHRDFKPANILVGKDGRARVTDFGLARSVGETPDVPSPSPEPRAVLTPLTRTGALIGTPGYMAPELWRRGAPDAARADQFAFCVTTSEALFGERPPPGAPAESFSRKEVPRYVKQALARGLASEASERFGSMAPLLRALTHDPRRPLRQALGAAGALAALCGIGALVYQVGGRAVEAEQCAAAASELANPWTAQERELIRGAFERSGVPYASQTFSLVQAKLDAWALSFEAARRRACETRWPQRAVPLQRLPAQLACLKDRAREARAYLTQLHDTSPSVVRSAVTATQQLNPLALCDALPADRAPSAEGPALDHVRDLFARSHALWEVGRNEDYLKVSEEAYQAAQALGDPRILASARQALGTAQEVLGKYDLATPNLLAAIEMAERAQEDRVRALAWVSLVQGELRQGHNDRVLFLEAPALGACDRNAEAWPRTEVLLFAGGALLNQGKFSEAQRRFEEAVQLRIKSYGERDYRVAFALSALGNAYAMSGQLEPGIDAHRRAIEAAELGLGSLHPVVRGLHDNLGSDYLYALRAPEAIAELEKGRASLVGADGPKGRDEAMGSDDLGLAYFEAGQLDRAESIFERTCPAWARIDEKNPSRAECLLGQHLTRVKLGKPSPLENLELALKLAAGLPPFIRGRIQLETALALEGRDPARAAALVEAAREGLKTSTLPLVQRELRRAEAWSAPRR